MNILIAVAALLVIAGLAAVFISIGRNRGGNGNANDTVHDNGASDGIVFDEAAAHALTAEIYQNSEPWPENELPEMFPVCGNGTVASFKQLDGYKEIIIAGISPEQLDGFYNNLRMSGWCADIEGKTGAVRENVKISTETVLYDAVCMKIYEFKLLDWPDEIDEIVPAYPGRNLTEFFQYTSEEGGQMFELRYQDDNEETQYFDILSEQGWTRAQNEGDSQSILFAKDTENGKSIQIIILKNIFYTSITIYIK